MCVQFSRDGLVWDDIQMYKQNGCAFLFEQYRQITEKGISLNIYTMQICKTVWCDCLSDVMFHSFFPSPHLDQLNPYYAVFAPTLSKKVMFRVQSGPKTVWPFFWRDIHISCIKISYKNRSKVMVTRSMGDLLDEDWPSSNRGTRLPSRSFFYLAKWIRLSLNLFCVYFLWIYRVLYVPQCCHFLCR